MVSFCYSCCMPLHENEKPSYQNENSISLSGTLISISPVICMALRLCMAFLACLLSVPETQAGHLLCAIRCS